MVRELERNGRGRRGEGTGVVLGVEPPAPGKS